jgi:Cu/Ag efflux protein CusF
MRMLTSVAAVLLAFLTLAVPLVANAQSRLIDGTVDESASKVTIKHGPINMDEGMTMVFAVQDPGMLKQVKAGDKVKFDADRVNGQLTVTKIQKAK